MLRWTTGLAAAAISGSGFSSGTFTDADGGAYASFQRERQRLQEAHTSRLHPDSKTPFISPESPPIYTDASARPTEHTYRAMTDDELITVCRTRERQIRQLRSIYSNFHYEADKHFRRIIFDYHDKALQLSQVHGKMQQNSLETNREAIRSMRVEQEMLARDKRFIFLCSILTVALFWGWVRRHYVRRNELSGEDPKARLRMVSGGPGIHNENIFSSVNRSARSRETPWETEMRRQREAQSQEREH